MIQIREIAAMTALNFGLEPQQLFSGNTKANVVLARQVAMYVARKATEHSTPVIGRVFGRDHTTVIHGIEKIEVEIKGDQKLKALVTTLIENAHFRARIEAMGGIDVIGVARRIAMSPGRNAIGASVMEVAALAATVLDLWEIARGAEVLVEALSQSTDEQSRERDQLIAALVRTITEEMAALRGITEEEEGNGSNHS